MTPRLATDNDTEHLLELTASRLREYFEYSSDQSESLVREYYGKFQDPGFCREIGIPVQDDDFLHHEGPVGLAQRIHYYLGLKGDPAPARFVEWREENNRQRKTNARK